jgi:general secretion pathway protein D
MVEEFEKLMDQQRYSEAVVVAKKARELAPQSEVVVLMMEKGRIARQVVTSMLRREKYQENTLMAMNDVDDSRIPLQGDIEFPEAKYWTDLTRERRQQLERHGQHFNEAELGILNALKKSVEVHFENQPIATVLEKLAKDAGINLYLDPEGLTAEGITSTTTVSLNLPKPISLRSALNLLLEPLHLAYVVQDEVLRVTSEEVRRGKVYQQTYKVADLVLTIPNFVPNNNVGLPGALREAHSLLGQGLLAGSVNQAPLTIMANNPGQGAPLGNASVLAQMASAGMVGVPGIPSGPVVGPNVSNGEAPGGGALVDFDTLVNLITTTVAPDTWEDNGGTGTIAGFPTNLTLVVSNTQQVHEQIVDLLQQLRRLQDLQITIEVRFITLNDNFFERIGVDFDFDLDDNSGLTRTEVVALDDDGPSVTVGLDPGGLTPDLDIRFRQGGFDEAIPAFGGFQAGSAANIGFAILSDIEAFFLITAAQGDTRTNVLQAPKVTLYDGQTASVSDVSQRPFVTSVIPVVGDFAAAHQPVITVLTEGTTLSVQAVVSNDRRFVRLTLVPFFSRIGDVDEFTFEGRTDSDSGTSVADPSDETQTIRDNEMTLREGTTVQLPTLAFTSVSTTVSVPDGGTILLGGIKRLSEGRNERGVPMLSKVPYVNRLFRNVGIGRETQSLMLMVTPRIIIQEEEEQKLGVAPPAGP